jgi:hypothetical protein
MQIHEPKVNNVPSLGVAMVKLKDAIKFSGESSMSTPT